MGSEEAVKILAKYGVKAADDYLAKAIERAEETLSRCDTCDGTKCNSARPGMRPEIIAREGTAAVHYSGCEKYSAAQVDKCKKYAAEYGVAKVEASLIPLLETKAVRDKICADCDGEHCDWGYRKIGAYVSNGELRVREYTWDCDQHSAWLTGEEEGSTADLAKKAEKRARAAAVAEKYGVKKMPLMTANKILKVEETLRICETECQSRVGIGLCECEYLKGKQPYIEVKDGLVTIKERDCQRYVDYMIVKRLKNMCVPRKYWSMTFDDYIETADNRKAIFWAKEYIRKLPDKSLYFHGGCGSGKTFLVSLMIKGIVRDNVTGRVPKMIFGDIPSLLNRIKEAFDKPDLSAQNVLKSYNECRYLFLDDMGTGKITDWSVNMLYEIINGRYNENKPVVITSNFSFEELERALSKGDAACAKRIISRLEEMCAVTYFGKTDYRKKGRK